MTTQSIAGRILTVLAISVTLEMLRRQCGPSAACHSLVNGLGKALRMT